MNTLFQIESTDEQYRMSITQEQNYLSNKSDADSLQSKNLIVLPDECNVFKQNIKENDNDAAQMKIVDEYMKYMYSYIIEQCNLGCISKGIPKPKFSLDEGNAIVVSFTYAHFRGFITFEGRLRNYRICFGIIAEFSEDEYMSITRIMTNDNYKSNIEFLINTLNFVM